MLYTEVFGKLPTTHKALCKILSTVKEKRLRPEKLYTDNMILCKQRTGGVNPALTCLYCTPKLHLSYTYVLSQQLPPTAWQDMINTTTESSSHQVSSRWHHHLPTARPPKARVILLLCLSITTCPHATLPPPLWFSYTQQACFCGCSRSADP